MQHQGDLRLKEARYNLEAETDRILPTVSKPNQYLGNEFNVCLKDPSKVAIRFALAYPDTYYIGMSHQGLKILYHILNRRSDTLAERVYAPWVDMESQMRKRGIPLFSLESRTPIRSFDVLGFTLQHELNFTNVLNMLDLAHVPLHVQDRQDQDPLVLAGGSCASNPEPLADFIDAFVIGDGEEVIGEIADAIIHGKSEGWSRREILIRLADLQGIYVPIFYQPQYDQEGRFEKFVRLYREAPATIKARTIPKLDLSHYPLRPLVPLTEIAHDRLSVEVMRGCTRGCRYCHAGMVYRPVREKAPHDVIKEVVAGIDHSGWDEISLVSLSSSDYSPLPEVVSELSRIFADRRVALSLPSLRPDSFTEQLAQSMKQVRRTGLTFAPESGTSRLRKVINKDFREEDLFNTLRIAFDNGWESVKLYFMIGLPTETWDDLNGIIKLGRAIQELTRKGSRKELHLSISPFTPKPHTPFQWERQDPVEVLKKKSRYLKSHLTKRGLRVNWRDPQVSFLEGVLARGDRQLGRVLELAWRSGCTFDSWTERFDFFRWQAAFSGAGIDPERYVAERPIDHTLPWDHISYGVSREFLSRERNRALQGITTPDCRADGCQGCGAHAGKIRREPMAEDFRKVTVPASSRYDRRAKPRARGHPQLARTRMRVQYTKGRPLRYLSHLDLIRLLERSIRRAKLPIAFSEGFHPHPKIAFGPPLPLGLTSQAEYLDMQFTKPLTSDLVHQLETELPEGMNIKATKVILRKAESLSSAINVAQYQAHLKDIANAHKLQGKLQFLLKEKHLPVQRDTPRETKIVDIRAYVLDLYLESSRQDVFLTMCLRIGQRGHVRPQEILSLALNLAPEDILAISVQRTAQYIEKDGQLLSPMKII